MIAEIQQKLYEDKKYEFILFLILHVTLALFLLLFFWGFALAFLTIGGFQLWMVYRNFATINNLSQYLEKYYTPEELVMLERAWKKKLIYFSDVNFLNFRKPFLVYTDKIIEFVQFAKKDGTN